MSASMHQRVIWLITMFRHNFRPAGFKTMRIRNMSRVIDTNGVGVPIFKPQTALILNKMTRYEYEKQVCQTDEIFKEEHLKNYLESKQSDYHGLLERHNRHYSGLENITKELYLAGIKTRIVNRWEFDSLAVKWADVIFSAGGDGTFLLAASKVTDKSKPVIGINTDPERSEGYLCLPKQCYSAQNFGSALKRLLSGDFKWKWRQRIRITMCGQHDNEEPIELHDQQLKFAEHRFSEHVGESEESRYPVNISQNYSGERVLQARALNEVFIGESLSSRVSYYEIKCDDETSVKQKSSGVTICTGTGSSSWYFHINHLDKNGVRDILKIGNRIAGQKFPIQDDQILQKITEIYNSTLRFDPSEPYMAYTIRDPIVNRVFQAKNPRNFAKRIWIRSRMWDSSLVIDGELSYRFNDGAVATMEILEEDALRTVVFE